MRNSLGFILFLVIGDILQKENTLVVLNYPAGIPVEMLPNMPLVRLVRMSETRLVNNGQ